MQWIYFKNINALIFSKTFLPSEVVLNLCNPVIQTSMKQCCQYLARVPNRYLEMLKKVWKQIWKTIGSLVTVQLSLVGFEGTPLKSFQVYIIHSQHYAISFFLGAVWHWTISSFDKIMFCCDSLSCSLTSCLINVFSPSFAFARNIKRFAIAFVFLLLLPLPLLLVFLPSVSRTSGLWIGIPDSKNLSLWRTKAVSSAFSKVFM